MRKPLPYLTDTARLSRVRVVRTVVALAFFLVIGRLFYWQILRSDQLSAAAEQQYASVNETAASRGRILTTDGYVLVTNQDVYTIFADPASLDRSPGEVSELLTPLIMESLLPHEATDEAQRKIVEEEWKNTILTKVSDDKSRWVSIKRRVPRVIKEKIEQLQIKGIGFERGEIRLYPEASMAAQVLGFVGQDARGQEQGYFGVEGMFDRELKGRPGIIRQEKDAEGLPIAIGLFDFIQPVDGRDIVLTIRRDLQFMLEEKLKTGMERYGSSSAEGVILDPKTGEILAMASFPQYDPALFYLADPQLYKNPIVNDVYEPGSTLKIMTVSIAIDTGGVNPETKCDRCDGPRQIADYSIKTWNNEYYPDTTMTEGLVHSDNTAMIFAAERVEPKTYVEYMKRFGLGELTQIDAQDEALPPFRSQWKELDIATASFGQGIAVTGIQMARIAQIIANDGAMMRPMLIRAVTREDDTLPVQPKMVRQVISKETADTVTGMMVQAAEYGDAKWAVPQGYDIAGKTGTAQIPVAGHYDDEKTIASFVGFAPAEDPKFVMLVKLREPTSSPWGSETAAPLWFEIARELFIRMQIAPK